MEPNNQAQPNRRERGETETRPGGKVMGGLVLVMIGSILLLRQVGAPIPYWITSWPMILIAVGIFVGARNGFRGAGWAILLFIGGAFLMNQMYPGYFLDRYIWPAMIIFIGLVMILRPRRRRGWHYRKRQPWGENWQVSAEDRLDATAIFSSIEKSVVSKNFQGGDVTVIFGGGSVNLSQAEFSNKAFLDVTQIFGGIELIVPTHWKVQVNATTIFGGIEDSRPLKDIDPAHTLMIDGTVIFGGIEIKSH